tara:strand:- start:331 stop:933 length:603 start_codon:yes stop_codon:yes gene_type:complete
MSILNVACRTGSSTILSTRNETFAFVTVTNRSASKQRVKARLFDNIGGLIDKEPDLSWAAIEPFEAIIIELSTALNPRAGSKELRGSFQVSVESLSGQLDDRVVVTNSNGFCEITERNPIGEFAKMEAELSRLARSENPQIRASIDKTFPSIKATQQFKQEEKAQQTAREPLSPISLPFALGTAAILGVVAIIGFVVVKA